MSIVGQYRLETPENVQVSFELAGPGSRFCAAVIDTLLMWLVILVLVVIAGFAGLGTGSLFSGDSADTGDLVNWINALLLLVIMLIVSGYYIFFELVMRGQTPGKRSMKLRVIRDDGTPAVALDIVIRNLVRVVDVLPGFYLVGGLVCMLSSTNKRLGDMAAGTLVVKDGEPDYRASADRKLVASVPVADVQITNPALTPAEQSLIRGFLDRRQELLLDARSQLATRLARSLFETHGGHFDDPESYLERLAGGRHFEH